MGEETHVDSLEVVVTPISDESRVTPPASYGDGTVRLHGEATIRGERRVPLSPISEGRFGRMFRRLPPLAPLSDDVLTQLADQMREPQTVGGWDGSVQNLDNPLIPAGFTYLGQFIDHDITFDPASSLQRQNDPDALHDFRSPRFDLDSLYGSGPLDEPFQYRRGTGGMRTLVEANRNGVEDLPRNSEDVALIGDPRNDENTIVGQLQLAFLKLHNKLAEIVAGEGNIAPEEQFAETQRRVRWHFQWIVVFDFLPRIIGNPLFDELFHVGDDGIPRIETPHYRPKRNAYMPVEFSAAAFRYGHSQVRGIYNLNDQVKDRPIFVPGPLQNETQDLRGFRKLPLGWTIDWRMFFAIAGSTPQPSRLIDPSLAAGLFDLPDGGGSLAFRNLKRGQVLGLPSGQDVARFLKIEPVLSTGELGGAPEPTPLWFYILKEAEAVAGGQHLGPVGGRIVGEVLLGLLAEDPRSWFSIDPGWKPTIPDADGDGQIRMADLIQFSIS